MSRIVEFAKPAYAWAGVRRPVSTAAAAANTEAVRIGNAPTMTEKIAASEQREQPPRRDRESVRRGHEPDDDGERYRCQAGES